MADAWFMGLDIGGGGGRCLLYRPSDATIVLASRPWAARCAPGTSGLGYDLDTDEAFSALGAAAREAIAKAGIEPSEVRAIACSAMRIGTVVIGGGDEVLYATTNRDARAVLEGLTLAGEHGSLLYRRTGRWPYPVFPAARLAWLRANRPAQFERARALLGLSDWLAWRLTGEMATDPTQAGESLLFDLAARAWAPDLISLLELPAELFPRVAEPGSALGEVGATAATQFGVPAGTPVYVGGGDTQCALLGAGVHEAGAHAVVAGTTAPVCLLTDGAPHDDKERLWSGHHLPAGMWMLESNAGALGESLAWLAELMHAGARAPVARLLADAGVAKPGAGGLLSTVGAQILDAKNMGLPMGDLALTHVATAPGSAARIDVARAVVDGLAFSIKANLEQLIEVSGRSCAALTVAGGLSRSDVFLHAVADACGVPVLPAATPDTSALGAAVLAAYGAGVHGDLAAAARGAVTLRATVEPEPARSAAYEALYERWRRRLELTAQSNKIAADDAISLALAANEAAARPPRIGFRPRMLVTADMDASSLERLSRLGDVEYASFRELSRLLTGPALAEALEGVHVFITEVDIVDAAALSQCADLRVVAACRSDAVNVHVGACSAYGVPVLHAPGRNAHAVADCTVAYVLMLARRLVQADRFLRKPGGEAGDMARMGHAFSTLRGHELGGLQIGLVGLGAVGRQVARRLSAFGANVLVADPFVGAQDAARADCELVSLEALLASSDIVSLHAAVTAETEGLIDAERIAAMKPGAAVVNTARAALVDETALLDALREGRLSGAALDVFSVEPPSADDPLLALDNVIATPHVAGNTFEVGAHQGRIIVDDLDRLLRGMPAAHALNPEVLAAFDWSRRRAIPSADRLERLARDGRAAVSDLQRDRRSVPKASRQSEAAIGRLPAEPSDPQTRAARERMAAILSRFAQDIAGDDAIREFSVRNASEVTLHFRLTDLDLDCYCRLERERVSAGSGRPDREADVLLRMKAEVFDGMFTGRLNPMEAAMDGRLSFTGDAGKAMTLQQLEKDLDRLYTCARAEVGDPGDLGRLGGARPAPVAAGANDRRRALCDIVAELYQSELITATGGNVSVRQTAGADTLWITPSRMFKGELAPESLVGIDLDGNPLDEDSRSPSSERLMHTAIYHAKPAAEAVIHCHAAHATILANADLPFLPISTEAAFFADIPRVPFIMPGTVELAEAVGGAIGEGWAVLMKNHGLIVAGRSLRAAADMAEVIERSAEVMLGCYAVGKEPPVLPADVIATLRKMGDMVA